MMVSVIQGLAGQRGREEENGLMPPEGWVIQQDMQGIKSGGYTDEAERYHSSVVYNLPLVAKRAEQLIDELNERFEMKVPVSYLRIDESTSFHVLLLIDQVDYMSPQIHAARILADQFIHQDDTFDIHFLFSIKSENRIPESILSQGYKLMHISNNRQNAA